MFFFHCQFNANIEENRLKSSIITPYFLVCLNLWKLSRSIRKLRAAKTIFTVRIFFLIIEKVFSSTRTFFFLTAGQNFFETKYHFGYMYLVNFDQISTFYSKVCLLRIGWYIQRLGLIGWLQCVTSFAGLPSS